MYRKDFSDCLEIIPCSSIHTYFIKFSLTIIFIDNDNIIIDFKENIPPWRICFLNGKTYKVLEIKYNTNPKPQI